MTIIEEKLYKELIDYVAQYIEPIQQNSHLIAQLDCLLSFSIAAKKNKYFPPIINEGHEINAEKKNPKQSKALSDERNKLKKFHYMVI